jgi:hypothetical protein
MADISDVETAILDRIAAILYPDGTAQGSALTDPATGASVPARLYRGAPQPAALSADMRAGMLDISIRREGEARSTTRVFPAWKPLPVAPPTLTVSVGGDAVLFGGTPAAGYNAAVVADGAGYVHAVQAGDTPASIAAALALQIGGAASSSGGTLTIPGAADIGATIGTTGTVLKEVARQIRPLQLILWAPGPPVRDAAAKLIVPVLRDTPRLALPDGSGCRLMTGGDGDDDDSAAKEQVWRRVVPIPVEYPTTLTMGAATVAIFAGSLAPGVAPVISDFVITTGVTP